MKYILIAFLLAVFSTSVMFLLRKAIENDFHNKGIAWAYWFSSIFVLGIGGISIVKVGEIL